MDGVGRWLGYSILVLILLFTSMFFASCGIAFTTISNSRVKKLAEEGSKRALSLEKLKLRLTDFLVLCDMSVILCISGVTMLLTYHIAPVVDLAICRLLIKMNPAVVTHTSAHIHVTFSVVITFLFLAFVTMMIGNTLPKKLVTKNYEKFALDAIKYVSAFTFILKPLCYFAIKIANGITMLFGIDPHRNLSDTTEDEIRMMLEAGNQSGSIELSECEMINNVFEFDDRTAGEVMTHRTDLVIADIKQSLTDVINLAIDEGFSRIPVYEDGIDDIVGTIYVKDLLQFIFDDKNINDYSITDFMREVIYVPESVRCRTLFKEFKEKKIHMAVIVDEYGGTAGIATMEDLLESIVGNIQDEYDQEENVIEKVDENTYLLDGSVEIEHLSKLFDMEIVANQHTETVGGFITNALGYIPSDNQFPTISVEGIEFTVIGVLDRRITKVKAVKIIEEQIE